MQQNMAKQKGRAFTMAKPFQPRIGKPAAAPPVPRPEAEPAVVVETPDSPR